MKSVNTYEAGGTRCTHTHTHTRWRKNVQSGEKTTSYSKRTTGRTCQVILRHSAYRIKNFCLNILWENTLL